MAICKPKSKNLTTLIRENFCRVLRKQEIMGKVLVENIRILFIIGKLDLVFTCNPLNTSHI